MYDMHAMLLQILELDIIFSIIMQFDTINTELKF